MVSSVSQFLTTDHRHCDELFATAELAAQKNEWAVCDQNFHRFLSTMEHHFKMEETILFPQLEELIGQTMGPIQVMQMEHEQIRDLLEQMADAVKQKNSDDYLGAAETLLIYMQQHNMKEEQILYSMADNILGTNGSKLIQRMENMDDAKLNNSLLAK